MRRVLVGCLVGLTVFVVHCRGTLTCFDSMWSVPTAISIWDHGDANLDEYRAALEARQYVFTEAHRRHVYTQFPIGTSLLIAVAGRFVQYVDNGRLAGTALFEIYEGDNRLVIDHGASGAPVFDCEGRVAAVISTVITQNLATPFGEMRIPTPWGSPNVVSVPVHQLMEFSKAQ